MGAEQSKEEDDVVRVSGLNSEYEKRLEAAKQSGKLASSDILYSGGDSLWGEWDDRVADNLHLDLSELIGNIRDGNNEVFSTKNISLVNGKDDTGVNYQVHMGDAHTTVDPKRRMSSKRSISTGSGVCEGGEKVSVDLRRAISAAPNEGVLQEETLALTDGAGDYFMDFLGKVNSEAEARLAARRQARAEAREIRMKELEKQNKESEDSSERRHERNSEPVTRSSVAGRTPVSNARTSSHLLNTPSYQSSRRSSEDSTEDGAYNIRDVRHELKELEEKFRGAMIQNAQLDNEKSALTYSVELLKDQLEDLEEANIQLQKEHKNKCREYEQLKRISNKVKEELEYCKSQLEEKDKLIAEHGLVLVGEEDEESNSSSDEGEEGSTKKKTKALLSQEAAQLLETAGEGSLDVRIRRFAEERNDLLDQIRRLKLDLEEERNRHSKGDRLSPEKPYVNGPDVDVVEVQREANKQLNDYKFRLQKAEQENSTLQANVTRLETQVIRYKTAAQTSEKAEDELKSEKRKLQRENREAQVRVEELETTNSHLQRRLDKLKTAKSTLLKEL